MLNTIGKEHILRRIRDDNPWWSTGSIEADYNQMPRRLYFDLFFPLVEDPSLRRAVVLMGPRRVGKTVMIQHAIQKLIDQGISPRKICYISIDAPIYNRMALEDLFSFCRDAVQDPNPEGFYVFFDEIQYLKNWEIHLKALVDSFRKCKFLASGSAAAALKLKSNESGAGRFTDFLLPPLTFHEFLHLKGLQSLVFPVRSRWGSQEVDLVSTTNLNELNKQFIAYINLGGYPEIVMSESLQKDPGRFIKNDIVDKVLLRDLPSLYGISDVQELNSLFNTVAFNTAKEFTLETLNQSSHVQKATIKRYLEYLEAAYLIRTVNRIDVNAKKFNRANFFKLYLTNPSIRRALFSPVTETDPEIGDLVETAVMAQWMHRPEPVYYARWQKGEVDIVGLTPQMKAAYAVEVKWSDRYANHPGELKSLLSFMETNHLKIALVTTISITDSRTLGDREIRFMPASLYAYIVGENTLRRNSLNFLV
jgi:predicted AAA+ superfamily ATPase